MDKRLEENMRVKKSITDALFRLLEKERFSDISISEIVANAGVARSSYYRNYSSKESIVETYLDDSFAKFREVSPYDISDYLSYDHILHTYTAFLREKRQILILCKRGFTSYVLDACNEYNEDVAGYMPANSAERYYLYYGAGAFFNSCIIWLKNGAVESPETMAKTLYKFINKNHLELYSRDKAK